MNGLKPCCNGGVGQFRFSEERAGLKMKTRLNVVPATDCGLQVWIETKRTQPACYHLTLASSTRWQGYVFKI